jgi:hypothetical protein
MVEPTRMGSIGTRYGRNKYCDLVLHLDKVMHKVACESTNPKKPIRPPIRIKCLNPDECETEIQGVSLEAYVHIYDMESCRHNFTIFHISATKNLHHNRPQLHFSTTYMRYTKLHQISPESWRSRLRES